MAEVKEKKEHKEVSKNTTKDTKENHKETKVKETVKETPKEAPKEAPAEVSKESATQVAAVSAQKSTSKRKSRYAVLHVFSSKNDTIITATDVSGAETLAWASGGMVVKADREEGKPYAAMQAALKVVGNLKDKGVTHVHIRIRAPGGSGIKTPGSGAQSVVRTIARSGIRVARIEDVTPLPTDSMKRKGGRRGRRV